MKLQHPDIGYIYDVFAAQAEDNEQDNRILEWLRSLELAMKLNQRMILEPEAQL